ncbi:MAG TPA: nuclear transport factor 2 family protein [Solirubrobacteraceae bacterium]|nr:nuclear transport factor 2 family protein [Solirubrobacteraceae bacterium]
MASETTAKSFRVAVEAKDMAAAGELLAADVVFHSPVTFHPFLGRETVSALLEEVAQVFKHFRYTDELAMDGAHALIFRAGVAGTDREIEGIDLLRFDGDGLIADFTVMLRPLSALVPFAQAMGERAQAAGLQTTRA